MLAYALGFCLQNRQILEWLNLSFKCNKERLSRLAQALLVALKVKLNHLWQPQQALFVEALIRSVRGLSVLFLVSCQCTK